MEQRYGDECEEDMGGLYKIMENMPYSNLKEWSRRNTIPLPKTLKDYVEKQTSEQTSKRKRRKATKPQPSPSSMSIAKQKTST